MCGLHVIFLSNITPRYFTLFTNGIYLPSIQCKMGPSGRRLRDTRFVPSDYKRDKVYSLIQLRDVCRH
jgi:hypothetical protein